ncbi:Peptidase M16 inactive domain protein [Polystyrenella longa]|uniref:Peptidase M16 inactive domain protein n=1 Tax=Polystyrenella longa TaxID=2528007 RepID=A0A518CST4_9PLAN|nr:pitrilysin family protein [Polystyrenella longa]QDU82280.1 Peptidase M16 inactive domain protein [Polystyrenella longa]
MKSIIRLFTITGCMLAMTALTGSGTHSHSALAAEPAHRSQAVVEYTSRQPLGQGVTLAKLSNGMTVIVQENHATALATVRCYVTNTGGAYEGEYLGAGISHLVEHLVSGGTTDKRSEDDVQELVDSLGGKTNAYTSNNITAYYIDAPAKRVDLAIELIADSMQHCIIPEEEYLRELGVVQRELEMGLSQRDRVGYQAMKQLIFTEHPMQHPIVGYLQVLQGTTLEDVRTFYKTRYVPQNMIFVVGGDVQTEDILNQVKEQFQGFLRTHDRGVVLAEEPPQASPRETTIEMEGETVELSVAWPTVMLQDPELYPLDVASYVLTNGDSARLTKRLKIDEPLAVSVSSASYTPGDVPGWFQVSVECKAENVERCREIIMEEIERLKTEPVSAAELAKVKQQKAAEHVFSQQTVQSKVESLARSFQSTGDPLFDEQYVKGIQTVTADEIQAVAKQFFVPQRLNTVRLVPIGLREATNEAAEAELESDVIRKELPNGVTLLLKRHAVTPLVSMQLFTVAGVLSDTEETAGRAALAASLFDRGTEKYTADQISEYFDSIGGNLTVESQRNTTYLQSTVLSQNFEEAFDYLFQVATAPLFLEEEFTKAQTRQLSLIAARKANPQAEIMDLWVDQLPADEAYSRTVLGNSETVAKLTVNDCRSFHNNLFVPENMVITIYGDIDIKAAEKLVNDTFGQLPAKSFTPPEFPTTHARSEASSATATNRRAGTALVMLGYPTVSVLDADTRATLEVIQTYLTGGLGGKLYAELRGARLVYYVYGFELSGLAPGYFAFLAQTTPDAVDEVISRTEANLTELRENGVDEETLTKVKEKMIAKEAMSKTTATEQAFSDGLDELYGLGYDYSKKYDERINAVTSEDIQKVIETYFHDPVVVRTIPIESEEAK